MIQSSFNIKELENKILYANSFKDLIEKKSEEAKSIEDLEKLAELKTAILFYQYDLSFLLNEIIFELRFVKKNFDIESEIVDEFLETLTTPMYKVKFVLVDGDFQEVEKGFYEKQIKEFTKTNQFKDFQKLLEKSSQV